jgi:hypothetical protein
VLPIEREMISVTPFFEFVAVGIGTLALLVAALLLTASRG